MVLGKINRGKHTNHPDGRHSIQTNQRPTIIRPFLCQMPFLPQPSQFILAWNRHQICWLAYPVMWEKKRPHWSESNHQLTASCLSERLPFVSLALQAVHLWLLILYRFGPSNQISYPPAASTKQNVCVYKKCKRLQSAAEHSQHITQ